MQKKEESRYIYSGASNSIQASIHAPFKAFLSDAPAAALQVVEGHISNARENINFHDIVRVGRATAAVVGERRDNEYVTLATSTLEKLNILDVITADAAVCRVTSVYPVGGYRNRPEGSKLHPAKFYLSGSHFDNLKIEGKLYRLGLEGGFTGDGGYQVQHDEIVHRRISLDLSEGSVPQPVINIPQFGTIHIGEVDIFGSRLTFTLLRVELGCPHGGKVAGPTSSTNGNDAP